MKLTRRVIKVGSTSINTYVLQDDQDAVVGLVNSSNVLQLYPVDEGVVVSEKDKHYKKLIASIKKRHGVSKVEIKSTPLRLVS